MTGRAGEGPTTGSRKTGAAPTQPGAGQDDLRIVHDADPGQGQDDAGRGAGVAEPDDNHDWAHLVHPENSQATRSPESSGRSGARHQAEAGQRSGSPGSSGTSGRPVGPRATEADRTADVPRLSAAPDRNHVLRQPDADATRSDHGHGPEDASGSARIPQPPGESGPGDVTGRVGVSRRSDEGGIGGVTGREDVRRSAAEGGPDRVIGRASVPRSTAEGGPDRVIGRASVPRSTTEGEPDDVTVRKRVPHRTDGGEAARARAHQPETDSDPDVLISARGLTKEFGDFVAVDGIDIDVRRGEAFGFLGPNGAGKSSTMRMIGCVSPLTEGSLTLFGMDPEADGPAIRGRLGVVPQKDLLDEELTVRENLLVYGRYFGLSRSVVAGRADELLRFAQLSDRADSPVEPLSGGMKRRLTIARALINAPEILLLDEPTTGLDPQARHVLWDRLYRLKQQGVTLVLTTHYMDEAEQLCDRLVVMDGGRIVAEGSPRELIERYSSREVVEVRYPDFDLEPHRDQLDLGDLAERVEVLPDRLLIYTHDGDAVSRIVDQSPDRPVSVLVRRSSLEDVFLQLTGRSLAG
ncbi:hypothetical protein GCM10022223_10120 [Kineosporia mesophila]|uniref:ABC transporter domain-containing protein n=1 Tax=Kineosporia mesophila TaxID=566012 RepID=A0ABP6Z7T9_9ACTN